MNGTVFFVYACHPGVFPVYKSLKNNTEKRINRVIMESCFLDLLTLIIYILSLLKKMVS